MSALTDRIAAEHGGWFNLDGVWRCNCGEPLPSSANADMWMRAHIAEVTEAAVREQVARGIEANYIGPDFGRNPITGQDSPHAMHAEAYDEGLFDAARIARGGAA